MVGAYARNTDPETSHIAANSINVTELEESVLARIKENRWKGATLDEIVITQKSESEKCTVSPRMVSLLDKGLIKRHQNGTRYFKRRGVLTNKMQIVNFATEFYDLERFL